MLRVRDTLRLWFSLRVPVGPRDYLVSGLTLMVVKYVVDATVMRLGANVFWSPIDYLNPTYAVRDVRTSLTPGLRTALILWTLPFLWIGASMTVRRAVDAGHSAWGGLLFFVPLVNYVLMIVLCFLPSRPHAPITPTDEPASSGSAAPAIDQRIRSAMLGLGVSLVIGFPLAVLCTVVLKSYGLSVFFGTPFVASVVTGFVHNRRETRPVGETGLVATTGLLLVAGSLLLFAVEGMLCVAMAFPFALPIAWMGALFGRELAGQNRRNLAPATWAVLAIPSLAALESRLPAPPPPVHEVVSSVDVAAPPEVVWRHVVSFKELPPPHETLFRLGVAYPQRATIRGHDVGALRRCEFSTGAFVEPITAWDAPRRLTFDVTEQPDPMRELSPWRHVVAPHVKDGFRAIRGEFRLAALPDGRTRLAGSTWYVLRIQPQSYWSLWADGFVRTIHLRVLEHVRREAETEWAGTPAPRGSAQAAASRGVTPSSLPSRPGEGNWIDVIDKVAVRIETVLYERKDHPNFFVHVELRNEAPYDIGVDLSDSSMVLYPNQWGGSDLDHRMVVDEEFLPTQGAGQTAARSSRRSVEVKAAHGACAGQERRLLHELQCQRPKRCSGCERQIHSHQHPGAVGPYRRSGRVGRATEP